MSLVNASLIIKLAASIVALWALGACALDATSTAPPTPESVTPTPTIQVSTPLPTRSALSSPTPEYDRDEWGVWIDADGDCQNTRAEVLIVESLAEVVVVECRVVEGEWLGPWSGDVFRFASEVDIDHHVPLAHAHRTGGSAWGDEMKVQFANDPVNLNAMSSSLNRSKGARGPDEWQPPDESSHCAYARQWEAVKGKYQLTIGINERTALDEMLATCDNSLPTPTSPSRYLPLQPSPTSVPTGRVYESCEEAEAAGEERVKGSKGPSRGFPKAMVPSKTDGDNDGVVCEE